MERGVEDMGHIEGGEKERGVCKRNRYPLKLPI